MPDKSTTFDMIAIGDTTQDIFLGMSDASVQCDINDEHCRICFDYADKIAVDTKTDVPAVGNAANHAIGMARLGLRAAVYTVIGDDVQGHLAADIFRENGVDPQYVTFDKKNGTNFSAVINYQGERTILVYHEPRDYKLPPLESTAWMYLTSASGDGVDALHQQVGSYLEDNPDVKMAFNPGTHQMHLGKEKLLPLLQHTQALFLNREESARVLGVETSDVKELCALYHEIGVKLMIMTDGPDGSYVSDGKTIWFLPIFDGPVIERTGAGDSYGAGFLGATLAGKPINEAMLWGNANSTSVVTKIGAREGLLTPDGIAELMAKNTQYVPKEFATF